MPASHDALAQDAVSPIAARPASEGCILLRLAEADRRRPAGDLSFVAALLATGRAGVPALPAPFVATPGGQY